MVLLTIPINGNITFAKAQKLTADLESVLSSVGNVSFAGPYLEEHSSGYFCACVEMEALPDPLPDLGDNFGAVEVEEVEDNEQTQQGVSQTMKELMTDEQLQGYLQDAITCMEGHREDIDADDMLEDRDEALTAAIEELAASIAEAFRIDLESALREAYQVEG